MHWPILPIAVPLVAAIIILFIGPGRRTLTRAVSLGSVVGLVVVAAWLVVLADDGAVRVYRLGNWPAPYGIVLVADRLAALMLLTTAVLALPVLLAATAQIDTHGRHFHPLLQLQLVGLNGAFLTGDIFNLFVFFEILLLASYVLLVHGGGQARTRAAVAYVVINLAGSVLFLAALALVYGTLGTLNIADMAVVLPTIASGDQAIVRTALALLVAVFVLKAALMPLGFWLPHVYSAAAAPVAALFAIMTKVGIYALLRVATIVFPAAPFASDLLQPWLTPLALATIALGVVGGLAARRLSGVAANLVVISTGTLLPAIAAGGVAPTAAALFYLVHTTLATGGLLLLAGLIQERRGRLGDEIEKGSVMAGATPLGLAFLVLAVSASGMPPLSGFLGKTMLMQSLYTAPFAMATWVALLLSSLAAALVLARAASALFWEPGRAQPAPAQGHSCAAASMARGAVALVVLVAAGPVLTAAAAPVAAYGRAAAEQLVAREAYIAAVLGTAPQVQRERRP